jgi:hypothetical protein
LQNECAESGEDLGRRKVGSEAVNNAECRLDGYILATKMQVDEKAHARRSIIVYILGFILSGNRHKAFEDGRSKCMALDLGFFAIQVTS